MKPASGMILISPLLGLSLLLLCTACGGGGGGGSATILSNPVVFGFARLIDTDGSGTCNAGDKLVIPFHVGITVDPSISAGHFRLPVTGNLFGAGATAQAGPADNEITITLGNSPLLKSRQVFAKGVTTANSPSGVDVKDSNGMPPGTIVNATTGLPAMPSTPIDIVPGFADSGQTLGANPTSPVAMADVDDDGSLDIVEGNFLAANRIWLNNGAGTFALISKRT